MRFVSPAKISSPAAITFGTHACGTSPATTSSTAPGTGLNRDLRKSREAEKQSASMGLGAGGEDGEGDAGGEGDALDL